MNIEEKIRKIKELGYNPVTAYKIDGDEVFYVDDKELYPYLFFKNDKIAEYPFTLHPKLFSSIKNNKNVIWGTVNVKTIK